MKVANNCMSLITIFLLFFVTEGQCRSRPTMIKPLIKSDVLAQPSRVELARLLYQKGVEVETAGNSARALRLWLNAYNLNSRNEVILERLQKVYEYIIRVANKKYQEGFLDLQYGRVVRAGNDLQAAHDILGGVDPYLERKIVRALAKIEMLEAE